MPPVVVCAEFYDDGATIWVEHEFYWDGLQPKTDEEVVTDLITGRGDWPGFGPDPRSWPGFLIAPDQVAFAMQLGGRGAWVVEAEEADDEDSVRRDAALLAKNTLRIHERCLDIRRAMR